jgi:hypothetical protein
MVFGGVGVSLATASSTVGVVQMELDGFCSVGSGGLYLGMYMHVVREVSHDLGSCGCIDVDKIRGRVLLAFWGSNFCEGCGVTFELA